MLRLYCAALALLKSTWLMCNGRKVMQNAHNLYLTRREASSTTEYRLETIVCRMVGLQYGLLQLGLTCRSYLGSYVDDATNRAGAVWFRVARRRLGMLAAIAEVGLPPRASVRPH